MAASASVAAGVGAGAAEVIAVHSLEEWTIQIEEANSAKKLVVIHFTASWCEPSRVIAPIFANLAKKFPDVVFLKVDVEDDDHKLKAIAEQFSVEGYPTFLFMKDGDVKDRVEGRAGNARDELRTKVGLHAAQ